MRLNWSVGIVLYMLIGGLIVDYKVQKAFNTEGKIEELYNKFPSVLVDMLSNRALVFAMGCFVGLPGWLIGLKDRLLNKEIK